MRGAIYHFSIAPVVDAVPLHTLHQPWQSYGIARRDYQPDIRSLSQRTTKNNNNTCWPSLATFLYWLACYYLFSGIYLSSWCRIPIRRAPRPPTRPMTLRIFGGSEANFHSALFKTVRVRESASSCSR